MKRPKAENIIVDVDRMKYPNTGLHNFCKNLMEFLPLKSDFTFSFFTHPKVSLPKGVKRINRKLIDKIFLVVSDKYALWHGTYQTTKFIPQRRVKFVLTIHDLNFLYEKECRKKQCELLKKVQKRIDRADYITTISEFVLNDIKQHLNLTGKRTKVIYNGVHLEAYPDFESPSYKPENKFLFTIGTVLPKKNFHVLLQLLAENKEYELLIAGIHPKKEYVEQIRSTAQDLGVEQQLVLLGAVSEQEKYWYMKNCEAFLFPSLAEGFGIPVIEAMLLGKPVFLSTKTSLPEIGGKYAYYFENFEQEHMNEVLQKGLKDYAENNKSEGIKKWAQQFSWEKAAEAYNEVYKEVLQG